MSLQYRVSLSRPLLDQLRSPAELLDQLPIHAGKLKVVLGPPDATSGGFQLCRKQMVEVGLVESAIAHRVSHFQGFPFFLNLIEGRIHREHVNVIMRVRYSIDWP